MKMYCMVSWEVWQYFFKSGSLAPYQIQQLLIKQNPTKGAGLLIPLTACFLVFFQVLRRL